MKKNNFLTKAFTLLFVLLFNLTGARAIVTHTVYATSTTENTIVPVNGATIGSSYGRSQFIIPKEQLSIMAGGKITNMYFHAVQDVVNWYGNNKFDVYVSETDASTISSYQTWSSLTLVYSGKIAINGHQLIIDFNAPFSYSGNKNLLIGFKQTAHGDNAASTFYGATVNNASIGGTTNYSGQDGTATQRNFIPRTTFVYIPGFIPTNEAVTTNVAPVTTITGEPDAVSATITWEGDADSYEVRYRTKRPLYAQDFSSNPTGWTIRKGNSAYGNGWIRENGMMASYSWYGGTKYQADNWLISPQVELGGILKYDCSVSAWHDIYEVRVSTTGIAETDFTQEIRPLTPGIPGTEDYDLAAYSGKKGYIAFHHVNYDGYWIDIDNVELSAGHAWKKATTTTNSVVLPRLTPDVDYEYVIIGIKHDDVNNVNVRGETANLTFSTPHAKDIILSDDESNEELIYDVAGKTYNAYLESRTFRDNGIWNTLALPFDVTVANSPFSDALIYTVLDRSSVDNTGLLTLRIDPLQPTTLKAGTPYLVTWKGAKTVYEPNFSNVTFNRATQEVTGSVTGGTTIVFKPNFNYLDFEAADPSVLFLSNNNLYSAGKGAKIKPQRGYFQTSDGSPVRGMVFELVDEETAIESVNGAFNNNPWYDLNGRKLTGKPVQKGIYINNGKKTIIK
ncbi:MAG: choice-of-anchor J domain-containing protein [Bacteroidaceae bacterium]|nr:choice-of-anchor J domain-containing protein [Bacteroidaceae bacterium]